VASYLAHKHKPVTGSALAFATETLLDFIKEQNMNGTRLELGDIVAQPAYDRLFSAMTALGATGSRALGEILRTGAAATLSILRARAAGGELAPPRFFGGLMTNEGARASDSPFAVWCGVLAKTAYQLEPQNAGLPELSVGLGIWRWEGPLEPAHVELLAGLIRTLEQKTAPSVWRYQLVNRDRYGPNVLISTNCTLIEVHQLSQGGDWDDLANDFYIRHVGALLEALAQPVGPAKVSLESALYEITGE
jgi:hypothetical protein